MLLHEELNSIKNSLSNQNNSRIFNSYNFKQLNKHLKHFQSHLKLLLSFWKLQYMKFCFYGEYTLQRPSKKFLNMEYVYIRISILEFASILKKFYFLPIIISKDQQLKKKLKKLVRFFIIYYIYATHMYFDKVLT